MDTETARTVFYAIATIGFIAWVVGLQFISVSYRSERDAAREAMSQLGLDEPPSGRLLVGRAEVEGQPAALAAKAAASLAKSGQWTLSPLKILEKTDDRVVFEGAGPNATGRLGWRSVGRGQLQFASIGPNRTAVSYAVEIGSGRWLLVCGGIFNALGLAALLLASALMLTIVVPSPNPAVRAQAVQMVQVIHFLWPPFLFGGLYRSLRRSVRVGFEVFVHNLPYCGEG